MSQYPLQKDSSSLSGRSSVRLKLPERRQVQWRDWALDQLLPSDHRARVVWRYVETLDLSPLYAKIAAVPGQAGRDAVDPRILMALWLFAITESVSSARKLSRLCERGVEKGTFYFSWGVEKGTFYFS